METINFEKVCRACLLESEELLNIFNVNISRKLMACANVQVWKDDGLPSHICNQCVANLHVAFQMKKRVEKSDQTLRSYLDKLKKEKLNPSIHQTGTDNAIRVEIPVEPNDVNETMPCVFVESNIEGSSLANLSMNHFLNQNQISYIQTGSNVQVISNYQTGLKALAYSTEYNNTFNPLETHDDGILPVVHESRIPTSTYQSISEEVDRREHIIREKQKRKCPTCKKVFRNQNKLNRHVKIHLSEKPYECKICKKGFTHGGNFKVHMRMHTGERPFECTICGKGFLQAQDVTKHMRVHTVSKMHSKKCSVPYCFSTSEMHRFPCARNLSYQQLWITAVNNPELAMYTPQELHNSRRVCSRHFTENDYKMTPSRKLLKAGAVPSVNLFKGERPYKCTMCDKGFATSSNLTAHKRTHTGEKPYVCPRCNKGFCQSNELKKHIRVHTGEKSHVCDICNKGFNGSGAMIIHRKTHTGDRQYQCRICEQSYKTPNVLKVHIKTHKKCAPCKKEFKTINDIKLHYFTNHGIVFDKPPVFDKVVCHFCNSEYHTSQEFLEHIKTHLLK